MKNLVQKQDSCEAKLKFLRRRRINMFKKAKEVKKARKVFGKAVTSSNVYVHEGQKIRITKSDNGLKEPVAREISMFMSAPSRRYEYTGSLDVNADRLYQHLQRAFPEYTWHRAPSQSPFDIYSFDAGIAVELKSVKSGIKKLTFNATVYPDEVSRTYVGSEIERLEDNNDTNVTNFKNSRVKMDVLVVCVERNPDADVVYNYAIVDGEYWGISEEDYENCSDLYADMNKAEVKRAIMNVIYKKTGNEFARKVRDGEFNGEFNLRKLIQLDSPVGRVS
jgi:hypothetical protein